MPLALRPFDTPNSMVSRCGSQALRPTDTFCGATGWDADTVPKSGGTSPRLAGFAACGSGGPDVDRTAKILPWDSPETGRVLSPVAVSSRYIAVFREAGDRVKQLPLADQDIVLTVP